ncbi:MAG: hypothetical protein AAFR04_02210 [Pseudomonadota bacterium]
MACALSPGPAGAQTSRTFDAWSQSLRALIAPPPLFVAVGPHQGHLGDGTFADARAALQRLPTVRRRQALAVTYTDVGHWRFANAAGERFTAANTAELERVAPTLLAGRAPRTVLIAAQALFKRKAPLNVLQRLGDRASLHLVDGALSLPLTPLPQQGKGASAPRFSVVASPHVSILPTSHAALREALWRLSQPLRSSHVRLIALDRTGGVRLPARPRQSTPTGLPAPERLKPAKLIEAFASLSGQTVMVSGVVTDGRLRFEDENTVTSTLSLAEMFAAAARHDVNLIIMQADTTAQPGAKTWLYQTVALKGFGEAIGQPRLGAVLDAFARAAGGMNLVVGAPQRGRLTAQLSRDGAAPRDALDQIGGTLSDYYEAVVGRLTGDVTTRGAWLSFPNRERQLELDRRVIPGIPSWLQALYVALLALGLLAWRTAQRWWRAVWAPERAGAYPGFIGYVAARLFRLLAFIMLFVPLVAPFALPAAVFALIARRAPASATSPPSASSPPSVSSPGGQTRGQVDANVT